MIRTQQICASCNSSHFKITCETPTATEGAAVTSLVKVQMSYSVQEKHTKPAASSYFYGTLKHINFLFHESHPTDGWYHLILVSLQLYQEDISLQTRITSGGKKGQIKPQTSRELALTALLISLHDKPLSPCTHFHWPITSPAQVWAVQYKEWGINSRSSAGEFLASEAPSDLSG